VSEGCRDGITLSTGERVPVTDVEIWSTFQSMLIVTSLYDPNTKPEAGGGVGDGGGGTGVGGGGTGVGGGVGVVEQLVVIVHGWPEPVAPLCVAGSERSMRRMTGKQRGRGWNKSMWRRVLGR